MATGITKAKQNKNNKIEQGGGIPARLNENKNLFAIKLNHDIMYITINLKEIATVINDKEIFASKEMNKSIKV